jgi:hypothetical protein
MKNILIYIVSMLSLIGVSACEKEIDLPINGPSRLVVNSLFNPDSLWAVHVSRSAPVVTTGPTPIVISANVQLLEDGVLLEQLSGDENGWYRSATHTPQPGKTYEIRVKAGESETVSATETMAVEKVPVTSAQYIGVRDANLEYPVTVRFKDPAGIKNYYILRVYRVDEVNGKEYIYLSDVRADEPTASSKEASIYGVGFTDALFDGKEYSFKLKTFMLHKKILVELRHVSEAYYQYHATRQAQQSKGNDPFSTPTQLFNNIQDGLGIFASYQLDRIVVEPAQ